MENSKEDFISVLNDIEIRCTVSDFENYDFYSRKDFLQSEVPSALRDLSQRITAGDYEYVLQRELVNYGFPSCVIDIKNSQESIKNLLGDRLSNDDPAYQYKEFILLFIAVSALQEFIRCNFCGPTRKYTDDMDTTKIKYSLVLELLPESTYSYSDIAEQFSLDGETIYPHVRQLKLLYLSRFVLENLKSAELLTLKWWLLRCTFLHQTILPERNESLHSALVSLITEVYSVDWMASEDNINRKVMFATECCHIFLYYGEILQAKAKLSDALSITGLEIEQIGAMGKRTQHQQKPTPQLFVKLERSHDNFKGTIPEKAEGFPPNLCLHDDTLLEQVSYTNNNRNSISMSAEEQLVFLSSVCLFRRSSTFDELSREQLMSYIDCLLSEPPVWSVYLKALIMRCRNERTSLRRLERAVSQMEAILDSIKKLLPDFNKRVKYIYSTAFPAYWTLEKDLADLLMELCCTKSALEIYERLELWENIVECYIQLGRTHSAEILIRQQLAKGETPMLWCILGDITEDTEFYLKAWELSNHRSARAQRSLGYYHYRKKEYQECISFFVASLEINHLQPQVWFSVGHAATQIENYELAARAYRQVVMYDEDSFEAWNNLANAYIKTKQKVRALRSLENALKYNHDEWRVWENFCLVSTDVGSYEDAIRAWHRLFDLKGKHGDTLLLDILINAIVKDLPDIKGSPSSRLKGKALKLLGRITCSITNDPQIWGLYALLINSNSEGATVQKEELEKAVLYQQKALRCYNKREHWEKDFSACQEVLACSMKLAELSLTFIKLLDGTLQNQQKTSTKFNLQNVITRGKKFLEDFPVDQKNKLNEMLESLNNTLNEILSMSSD